MRLYAPLYEGDSILRPDAALGEPTVKVFKSAAPAPSFVRSNIQLEAANETALDINAIAELARSQRNAAVARMLKSLFKAVAAGFTAMGAWFDRDDNFMRDSFFAASENLVDLEQRQRHFERTGMTHY